MAKCSKCGSPLCKCGSPNHYSNSPMKQIGSMVGGMAAGGNTLDQLQQQTIQPMVQPMTNVTPIGSSLVKPFSPQIQTIANGMFGNNQMRQNSVNAPFMYKDGSPLEGNAFIAAKIAAEKAGKSSFKVGGKTFPVK